MAKLNKPRPIELKKCSVCGRTIQVDEKGICLECKYRNDADMRECYKLAEYRPKETEDA